MMNVSRLKLGLSCWNIVHRSLTIPSITESLCPRPWHRVQLRLRPMLDITTPSEHIVLAHTWRLALSMDAMAL